MTIARGEDGGNAKNSRRGRYEKHCGKGGKRPASVRQDDLTRAKDAFFRLVVAGTAVPQFCVSGIFQESPINFGMFLKHIGGVGDSGKAGAALRAGAEFAGQTRGARIRGFLQHNAEQCASERGRDARFAPEVRLRVQDFMPSGRGTGAWGGTPCDRSRRRFCRFGRRCA